MRTACSSPTRTTTCGSGHGLDLHFPAEVSPTDAHSDLHSLLRETVAVGLGRVVGYDRLDRW